MKENKPKSRKNNLVIQDLEHEILVYDLETNQAFCLNKTLSLVWQLCDGNNSISDISDLISKKMKILISEDFILLALNELHKHKLLKIESEFQGHFVNFNRREIIKRVGLSTMIALPIISSIVAPTSANAASTCLGNNQPVSCDSTGITCSQFPFLGPNAWRCVQPLCCSGTCVNADTTMLGLTACD